MTTNPLWDEILKMMNLTPGCLPQNSPNIIARVFKLKLNQLLEDIQKNSVFGKCIGGISTIVLYLRLLISVLKSSNCTFMFFAI